MSDMPYQGIQVRERPIPFSPEMMLALLAGQKTQTRRIVKPTYPFGSAYRPSNGAEATVPGVERCPYGTKGDRLWVRETWRVGAWSGERQSIAVDYRADGFVRREWLHVADEEMYRRLVTQSRVEAARKGYSGSHPKWPPGEAPTRWRVPRFMPRWASRITLEVTDVRVERVQAISDEDALSEGIEYWLIGAGERSSRRRSFARLWDEINGDRGSWASNPSVWAITFKRIEAPHE